ncbi:MAG: peptidoglycan DD-metalloendopeptidase family protein [Fusobacteriaceae bacterium]|jgi:septal ring factor EnvC (AmiA/AmiB activator)|nr:peptidoglycan DD-metalloendopeptidase family protein [Fusobacteriaceae bacterium]
MYGGRNALLLFSLLLAGAAFSGNVSELENKVRDIDAKIERKQGIIREIDGEKKTVASQIQDIDRDMRGIEKEQREIINEINVVSKNIDYGEKSLGMTTRELDRKRGEYGTKIILWDKYVKSRGNNPNDSLTRKNFRGLLYGDISRMEHIQSVQFDIQKVKREIEYERKKLGDLRNKLDANKKEMDAKKGEKSKLMAQLDREQRTHREDIQRLRREKERINREITAVINQRTTRDESVATIKEAALKIGKLKKPVAGSYAVLFGEAKGGAVESNGIEIASKMGTQVTAAASGKVVYADKFQGLGSVVMINYGYNTIGVYGNLISLNVKLNQQVKQGEAIGVLGLSSERKPNLYYELRFNSKPINPTPYF